MKSNIRPSKTEKPDILCVAVVAICIFHSKATDRKIQLPTVSLNLTKADKTVDLNH
jgi:hypothetical protein